MTDTPAPEVVPAAPAPVVSERDQFISMLPEELRTEGVFANHKNVGDLAKSYVSAAKMVGMDKSHLVSIPKDDAPESWNAVYEKLGRPETPDKYSLENYKDSIKSEDAVKPYLEAAHAAGLNQKQVDVVFGKFFSDTAAIEKAQAESAAAQLEAWNGELKKEYGMAFEQKLDAAVNSLEKIGGEPLIKLIEENPNVFKNPVFAKFAVAIAEKTGEGDVLLANGTKTNAALSPSDAKQQLNALQMESNYQKAILDKMHPQHAYYVEQRQKLFAFAFPE